jgi:hypothetical protein
MFHVEHLGMGTASDLSKSPPIYAPSLACSGALFHVEQCCYSSHFSTDGTFHSHRGS